MNICFFRHGPAVDSGTPGIPDEARTLTEDGRRKTRAAVRGLKYLKLGLDSIICSPLHRALETAEIVAGILGLPHPRSDDRLLPGSTAAQILEVLKKVGGNAPILVGHEPSLSAALSLFISGADSCDMQFKKAGMAFANLKTLSPLPRGTLILLLTPAALRRLGN